LQEISDKLEKESRIKLELHSVIALLCMRLGVATSDEQTLAEMLTQCDRVISETDFDA
jgi:hypothetical protein